MRFSYSKKYPENYRKIELKNLNKIIKIESKHNFKLNAIANIEDSFAFKYIILMNVQKLDQM